MIDKEFDMQALHQDATLRAWRVAPDEIFSLLRREVEVPAGWMARVDRRHGDPGVFAEGATVGKGDVKQVLWVRPGSLDVTAQEDRLRTRDGYAGSGTLCCRVRLLTEPNELVAFEQMFLSNGSSLQDSSIRDYFSGPLQSALRRLVSEHTAEALIQGLNSDVLSKAVKRELESLCMRAGLALDGAVALRFASEDHDRALREQHRVSREVQQHEARRSIQRALAQAQAERLNEVAGLLEKMQAVATSHDGVELADLVRRFAPSERDELYAALWHLDGKGREDYRTESVALVAGNVLMTMPMSDPEHAGARIEIPADLGALRSVQVDRACKAGRGLLIGAANGVWMVDLDQDEPVAKLAMRPDGDRKVRGGFNAAARDGDTVYATHSELGLVRWTLGDGCEAVGEACCEQLTQKAESVRCAQIVEGSLWFTVDESVYSLATSSGEGVQPVRYGGSDAILTALRVDGSDVFAGNAEGEILHWHAGDPESASVIRGVSDGLVESIQVQRVGGLTQLIVADRRRGLGMLVVEDGDERRHASRDQIVRRAAVASDAMAAMNDARDRVIVWRADAPREPLLSAHIEQLTGHRIQDLCLVPVAT